MRRVMVFGGRGRVRHRDLGTVGSGTEARRASGEVGGDHDAGDGVATPPTATVAGDAARIPATVLANPVAATEGEWAGGAVMEQVAEQQPAGRPQVVTPRARSAV